MVSLRENMKETLAAVPRQDDAHKMVCAMPEVARQRHSLGVELGWISTAQRPESEHLVPQAGY